MIPIRERDAATSVRRVCWTSGSACRNEAKRSGCNDDLLDPECCVVAAAPAVQHAS